MQWEVVIGLETHTQLATRSKIFSGASTAFGAAPNTQASAVDLALPGVLPVLNAAVVDCAIRLGLAVGGTIAPASVFARKNYFYPDLPKGYQISQYETPVVAGGQLAIVVPAAGSGGEPVVKTIRLTRAHLEEDAGKSLHEDFAGQSGIDLNRAGTPLLEIVSEPDMRSAAEAVAYARTLHGLVTWLGICDGNMQEGSFRVDANVSVRPQGQQAFGTRCEIKNLNSFRFLERAINFEVRRQIGLIEDGGRVVQETRLYDPDADETRSMRSKEDAHDYRYFPDPDLPALVIEPERIRAVRDAMPELPASKRQRYRSEYGLGEYDALALTGTRDTALYFEAVVAALSPAGGQAAAGSVKLAANWIMVDLTAQLNRDNLEIADSKVSAAGLARLVERIADGTVSGKIARDIFQALWTETGSSVDAARARDDAAAVDRVIDEKGLRQISDSSALEPLIEQVLAENERSVQEFRAGKQKAFNALVGQVMKASRGKANPQQVNDLLRARLDPS
ncbi:MAG TPA: Asp-tRNA(Asn)/Glu-tRNA(Gln) amidotransferase subunit GatB [Lautropia sp.]|nr:Asp-tRNA(Asn)/Glu-tRNA(Gln) amidotransferase subunit GatB [Lautropia sp.]